MVGRIDLRFVIAGPFHAGFQIVGYDDFWNAAEEMKHPDVGLDPGWKVPGKRCKGNGIAAGAQGGHEREDSTGCSDRLPAWPLCTPMDDLSAATTASRL